MYLWQNQVSGFESVRSEGFHCIPLEIGRKLSRHRRYRVFHTKSDTIEVPYNVMSGNLYSAQLKVRNRMAEPCSLAHCTSLLSLKPLLA